MHPADGNVKALRRADHAYTTPDSQAAGPLRRVHPSAAPPDRPAYAALRRPRAAKGPSWGARPQAPEGVSAPLVGRRVHDQAVQLVADGDLTGEAGAGTHVEGVVELVLLLVGA